VGHSASGMSESPERRTVSRQSYRLSGPVECIECGEECPPGNRGWRGYRIPAEDGTPEIAFYCPRCAEPSSAEPPTLGGLERGGLLTVYAARNGTGRTGDQTPVASLSQCQTP